MDPRRSDDPEAAMAATSTADETGDYRSLLQAQLALTGPLPEVEIAFKDLTLHVTVPNNTRKGSDEDLQAGRKMTAADAPRPHIPTVFGVLASPFVGLGRLAVNACSASSSGIKTSDSSSPSSSSPDAAASSASSPTKVLKVLDGASGTLKPGRMALILAPPGASKSSLLKALSDRLTGVKKELGNNNSGPVNTDTDAGAVAVADTVADTGASSEEKDKETEKAKGVKAQAQIKPGRLYGSITYSGLSQEEALVLPLNLGSLISYVPQADEHYAALNVRETLSFAAYTKRAPLVNEQDSAVGSVAAKAQQLLANPSAAVTDMMARLRLQEAENTLLGNEQIKGCSGGQRKRVTIAEALIGHHRVAFLDQVSDGLDSSTTLELMRNFKEWARVTKGVVCAALLQPTPETFALFDDVLLLKDGAILYFGPREELTPYLASLGFHMPSSDGSGDQQEQSSDLADYVVSLLANPQALWEKQRQQRQKKGDTSAAAPPPLTTEALVAAWKRRAGPDGRLQQQVPSPSSPSESAATTPLTPASLILATPWAKQQYGSAYPVSTSTQLKHLLIRQTKLTVRDVPFMISKVAGAILMSLVLGSLFSGSQLNFTLLMGCALFGLIHLAFGGGIEIPVLIEQRFTVYKQLAANMYRPALVPLAVNITLLPLIVGEVLVFSSIAYFLTGFNSSAGQFFYFFLILFLIAGAEGSYFRLIAYLATNTATANSLTGPVVSMQVIFAGYLIAFSSIPPWFIWLYWISPLSWALRALANNELNSSGYDQVLSNGQTMREFFLGTFEFQGGNQWLWSAVVFIVAFWILLLFASMLALDKVRFDRSIGSARPELLGGGGEAPPALLASAAASSPAAIVPAVAAASPASGEPVASPALPDDAAPTALPASSAAGIDSSSTNNVNIAVDMGVVVVTPASAAADAAEKESGASSGASTPLAVVDVSPSSPPSPMASVSRPSKDETNNATTAAVVNTTTTAAVAAVTAAAVIHSAHHALPFTPASLAFKDIGYDVDLPKKAGGGTRRLLRNVSGFVQPGQLLLLMGSSGAGKSTLLDAIAGRKTSGRMTGQVFFNGQQVSKRIFSRQTAYVEQVDTHSPFTTIREALVFSADLRLPSSVTRQQKEAFVDEILETLELTAIQHKLVGRPNSDGLSPSEFKRLSIGVELCGNSPIIFTDEPTTGLSSREAEIVMRVLRRIADGGRSVISTIHAPSYTLYSLADSLLLLQKGGYQVYCGPLGASGKNIVRALQEAAASTATAATAGNGGSRLPYAIDYPADGSGEFLNPASYMLDALAAEVDYLTEQDSGVGSSGGEGKGRPFKAPVGGQYAAFWQQSEWKKRADRELEEVIAAGSAATGSASSATAVTASSAFFARSFPYQLWILLKRCWFSHNRNLAFNLTRLVVLTCLGLLFGGIYYRLGPDAIPINSIAAVTNTISVIFLCISFSGIITFSSALPLYEADRALVFRETRSQMYTSFAYSLAMLTVEIPWLIGTVLVFCSVSYFLIGLVTSQGAGTFFHYALVVWESGFFFSCLSHFFAAAFPSVAVAQATGGLIVSLYFLLAGLFAPRPQVPKGWAWFMTVNPLAWALDAVVSPQLQCYSSNPANCPSLSIPMNGVIVPVPTGLYVSSYFGLDYSLRWVEVGYLFLFILAFGLAGALSLRYINWIKR